MSKIYKIYIKDKCVYKDLKEEEFNATWTALQGMVGLMKTDYTQKDISYLVVDREKRIDGPVH